VSEGFRGHGYPPPSRLWRARPASAGLWRGEIRLLVISGEWEKRKSRKQILRGNDRLSKRRGAAMSLSRRRAAADILVSRGRSTSRPVDNDNTTHPVGRDESKARVPPTAHTMCASHRVVLRMTAWGGSDVTSKGQECAERFLPRRGGIGMTVKFKDEFKGSG
jgi:hypothetical protein